ncbi:MAG: hypothetical protein D6731_14940, partial [Planctomycetota bacterium]
MKLTRSVLVAMLVTATMTVAGCSSKSSSKGGAPAGSTAGGSTAASSTLPDARADQAAVLLQTGEILVAGGVDANGNPMASTVLIDAQNQARPGPDMSAPRVGHSMVPLASGEVLIIGGHSDAQGMTVLDTTEIYDPTTNSFRPGPALTTARSRHVAMSYSTAQGERVLVAGGLTRVNGQAAVLSSAEVIDVAAGLSSPLASSLSQEMAKAKIVRLDTGKLLICSGVGTAGTTAPNVFDPATETFTPIFQILARTGAAVASRGSEVLVTGGVTQGGNVEASSEVFTSATQTFSNGVPMSLARRDHTATVLAGGDIFVVGGIDASGVATTAVERVSGSSLASATVSVMQPLQTARYLHSAIARGGSDLVIIGGFDVNGVALNSIETVNINATGTPTTPPTT